MSDRIEAVLLHTLEQAKGAVQIAKDALEQAEAEHASRQRDVDNCKALLAHHRKLTVAGPMTEAFPTIPARSAKQGVTVADIQQGVAYLDRAGQAWQWRGDTAMPEEHPLLESGGGRVMLAAAVIEDFGPLRVAPNVAILADVAPAPDPTATISDPTQLADLTATGGA